MESPINEIERAAAEWAAKIDGNTLPADQMRAFEAWLAGDPRHLGAYLKVEAVLARVTRLGADGKLDRPSAKVVSFESSRPYRRRYFLAGAIAASLVLVIAGGTLWNANSFSGAYRTGLGEMKTVTLPDGSALTLNTETSVTVHYSPLARDVSLDRGEALFDVAKNKMRPFVVTARGFSVRAVGTSFAVADLSGQPVSVTVREGIVALSGNGLDGATQIAANVRAVAVKGRAVAVESLKASQLQHEMAWLDGKLFFRQQSLASAVREFDRYSTLRIVIDDPSVASRTVTGIYVATDPAGFARAVSVFMDLQLETDGAKIYLRQKKA